ncbi:MAG: MFS transporter [Flavobacteriia bacterium]|nr:MFS transporter [Flavobacteriia bacterium]
MDKFLGCGLIAIALARQERVIKLDRWFGGPDIDQFGSADPVFDEVFEIKLEGLLEALGLRPGWVATEAKAERVCQAGVKGAASLAQDALTKGAGNFDIDRIVHPGFTTILLAACFIGIGSSVFHPEASRVAYYASGGKRGLAQAIFQLGGNAGATLGPLLVAFIVVPHGQHHIVWFVGSALIALMVLTYVGRWYKNYLSNRSFKRNAYNDLPIDVSKRRIVISIAILLLLIFSKFFYTASISNYFTFYLIDRFQLSVQQSQLYLFAFMGSVTLGTLIGGPLGDKYGRKIIIWFSIVGAAPFSLMMPYADLTMTCVFSCLAGAILASAFSSILVYAQELLPGKIGMVSGLFYGFAFGMGGLGSALLGYFVDKTSISFVYQICSFLPLIGMVTLFLPNLHRRKISTK